MTRNEIDQLVDAFSAAVRRECMEEGLTGQGYAGSTGALASMLKGALAGDGKEIIIKCMQERINEIAINYSC